MIHREQIKVVDNGVLVLAPAKINLSLLVGPLREDGYHEIETLMAKVNWYDEVFIERGQKTGIELFCEGGYWAPEGKDNLVYKACELLFELSGKSADIKITLRKNIPAGSGLGSASSDAAATLIGINKYLDLKVELPNLIEAAVSLGSDVPFFLNGPLAFCEGRGEKIKKIKKKFDFLVLLVFPGVSVSTKRVYRNYEHNKTLFHSLSRQINAYIQKNKIDLVAKMCPNMLEESCFRLYSDLEKLKKKIESLSVRPLGLSGSGSSMFYLGESSNPEKLEQAKCMLEENISCECKIVSNNRW
ncbi:MAG: 4-(cytidine 5'-diphospho)-2-C-methyl-D-erythritol kinase [Planctomycetota bacterium]|jgi:4-diphosphocytidyl-2-C-methyl-D-erythritol kinase